MFIIASIIFLIFSALYVLAGVTVMLHLRWYSLPGHPLPRFASLVFVIVSATLWLGALVFLLRIPS